MKNQLTIGLFGFGCVGEGLYKVLHQSGLLDAKIKKIVIKNPEKQRSIPKDFFSVNAATILEDDQINLVVELISDADAAYQIVREALNRGKHVVTANKKMLAFHFEELTQLAQKQNVSLLYEAAVAGSIPVIRNLEEYYNNDSLSSVEGIINGTTNYILTQTAKGLDYQSALKKAQDLGFAEADPSSDVEGLDAKYKLLILIKHAFGLTLEPKNIFTIGISKLQPYDLQLAREKGWKIKLVAKAIKIDGICYGYVLPHFVDDKHPFYNVSDSFNAVLIQAAFSDKQLFYGKGAGSFPTASAVLSDVSALLYDYRYEYRKTNNSPTKWDKDCLLKIYVSSTNHENLKHIPFLLKEEEYRGKSFAYSTGLISLSSLEEIQKNENELSIIALAEENELENVPTELLIEENQKL
jgi:homoserine dehydrogenase